MSENEAATPESGGLALRKARAGDLPAIVALLADDALGRMRETPSLPLDPAYLDAFAAIERNPDQLLAVAVSGGEIVGTLQISFLPGLSHTGMWRGQIEAVRVSGTARGQGLGERMIRWAIAQCERRGCGMVQLTSAKTRADALRFYERLGFSASHEGFKLKLPRSGPG